MPIFPSTLPTCAACGAFLTPDEQEANLLLTSARIATRWPLPIRIEKLLYYGGAVERWEQGGLQTAYPGEERDRQAEGSETGGA